MATKGKKAAVETKKGFQKFGAFFKKKKPSPKPKSKPKKDEKVTIKRIEEYRLRVHEGDWEHIDVYIKPTTPGGSDYIIDKIFYARHLPKHGGFDPFKTVDTTHPIVYTAVASHASHGFTVPVVNSLADVANGKGARWQTWKNIVDIGSYNSPTPGNEWIKFKGKWGEVTAPPRTSWWLKQ